jgi:hypothetical protein
MRPFLSPFLVVVSASVVGCAGIVSTPSDGKKSDAQESVANGDDAGTVSTTAPAASPSLCANATHIAIGQTIEGTTCGGTQVGESPCQSAGHSDTFLYVEAPAGTALHFAASPGLSVLGFLNCDSTNASECAFGGPGTATDGYDPTDSSIRLFGLERQDAVCGSFTITVSAR